MVTTSKHNKAYTVGIISNPLSTTNQRRLPAIRQILNDQKNVIHFELDHINSIRQALELFNKVELDLLIINSGDGTVGAVMAMLLNDNILSKIPPIAILPGGKTNMTAADLNVSGTPEKVLRKIFQLVNNGEIEHHIVYKNVIEMDMNDGNPKKVGTFFGGAGVVSAIHWCRDYAHTLKIPIALAHIWTIFNLILSKFGLSRHKDILMSDQMSIHLKGHGYFKGRFSIMTVTSLDRLLLGMKPFDPKQDGPLRMALMSPDGKVMVRGFWALLRGIFAKKNMKGIEARNSHEIKIESRDPVTLDGEVFNPLPGKPIILRGDKTLPFLKL